MTATVFILHGTFERSPYYAHDLASNLPDLNVIQGFYGDLFQSAENGIITKIQTQPLWSREHMKTDVRLFMMQFILDMTEYITREDIRTVVHDVIFTQVPKDTDLHLVLHSWGGIVGFDCINEEVFDPERVKSITSIGCPLHMWPDESINFKGKWLNFFHSIDILSAPLNALFGCQDFEITDAGPPTELVGDSGLPYILAAHNCYFRSKQLASHILELVK